MGDTVSHNADAQCATFRTMMKFMTKDLLDFSVAYVEGCILKVSEHWRMKRPQEASILLG